MRIAAFTIIAMLMLIGCRAHPAKRSQKQAKLPTSAPAPIIEQSTAALPVPAEQPMPVAQGPAPLIYIVRSASTVRIAEIETGSTVASFHADSGSIISINQNDGIRAGGELMVKGPLPAARTYQIFLDEPSENLFRSERIRPGRP